MAFHDGDKAYPNQKANASDVILSTSLLYTLIQTSARGWPVFYDCNETPNVQQNNKSDLKNTCTWTQKRTYELGRSKYFRYNRRMRRPQPWHAHYCTPHFIGLFGLQPTQFN